jgi:hypothetical protein|tara:strand:+ start:290 stop:502 length:213 start_codon:yes stop_codon:yes gene_type:complete
VLAVLAVVDLILLFPVELETKVVFHHLKELPELVAEEITLAVLAVVAVLVEDQEILAQQMVMAETVDLEH